MTDCSALADRLYAESLGASLGLGRHFGRPRSELETEDIESYVRERLENHREELGATEAEAEDAFDAARERWRKNAEAEGATQLLPFVRDVARSLLQPDGQEMILRVDRGEPSREILRWRFVSLQLPPSILIAAAADQSRSVPRRVRLLHDVLAPDLPVAEQHVHHAANTSFDELWESLRLDALVHPGRLLDRLRTSRAACPGLHRDPCPIAETEKARREAWKSPAWRPELARHMTQWADLLRQAFIAGRLLERHAHHRAPLAHCVACRGARSSLRYFLAGRTRPYGLTFTPYPWIEERYLLQRKAREADKACRRRGAASHAKVMQRHTARERSVVAAAFRRQEQEGADSGYEVLLLQYLRVKTALYRLLVQPPGERGLEKFLEHFRQIKVYMPSAGARRPGSPDEPGLDVRAVEYRIAPDAWLEMREDAIEVENTRAAWIVHFKRGSTKPREQPLYGSAFRSTESDADKIARELRARPHRLQWLRGIDLCGVEGTQPLWVAADSLRRLRETSCRIVGSRPELALRPLRMTLHVGEDFDWLTSGVRAVAEPFVWNLIERGDRIGHAIAITLEPDEWVERRQGRVLSVRRWDRLQDLAFLAEYANDASTRDCKWLQQSVEEAVSNLGLREAGTAAEATVSAQKLWKMLGTRRGRQLLRTRVRPLEVRLHEVWAHHYFHDPFVRRKAGEVLRLRIDERNEVEWRLLSQARRRLIGELARWQVAIESNPSSNLVVAGLADMGASQDFLQERPTKKRKGENANHPGVLTWTINTDDPITFSTSLADEYAYAWAGMVSRPNDLYDPAYARALLDEAAATSLRTSFVAPRRDLERRS